MKRLGADRLSPMSKLLFDIDVVVTPLKRLIRQEVSFALTVHLMARCGLHGLDPCINIWLVIVC